MLHDNYVPQFEITQADRKDYGKCFYKALLNEMEWDQALKCHLHIDPKRLPEFIERAQATLDRMGIKPR